VSDIAFEGAILFALILANGLFAMSEIAVVSARKARLKELADRGNKKAAAALELAHAPEAFLSTVQVGITLVGVFAGAFGGATVAESLAKLLQPYPRFAPYGEVIGVGAVVLAISYFSLVLGELVPKRIALSSPERIASLVAVPMTGLARIASPLVHLLTASSSVVMRLLRIRPSVGSPVTEEEIKVLLAQGAEAGTFERAELDIVQRVFRLADRHVASVMTPRNEVIWMDLDQPPEERRRILRECGRSQFPVARGTLDAVQGVLRVKDWLRAEDTPPGDEAALLQRTLFVPETANALALLDLFQKSRQHIAVVLDEHGGTAGLVTLHDILEAIVGDLPPADEESEPLLVKRADGSWLVDGSLPVSDFKDALDLPDLPQEAEGHFHTVGGLVMYILRQVPRVGDVAETGGLRLEVVDMDGRRVDRVLVSEVTSTSSSSPLRSS
jgi:putative hemolysin